MIRFRFTLAAALITAMGLLLIPVYFALPYFSPQAVAQTSPLATVICGNGKIELSEACDDGNTMILDGCTGCLIERGYRCKGQPSACAKR